MQNIRRYKAPKNALVLASAILLTLSCNALPLYAETAPSRFDCEVKYDLSIIGCHSDRKTNRPEMIAVAHPRPAGGGFVPPIGGVPNPSGPGGGLSPFWFGNAAPYSGSAVGAGVGEGKSQGRTHSIEKTAADRPTRGASGKGGLAY